jgi:CBS domain-containing protein
MRQWRVSDVMTTEVISTPATTPVAELVEIMSTHRISAVPIVADDSGVVGVVGIVSEADLLAKIAATGDTRDHAPRRRRRAKATATSAGDLMSAPALSVAPDTTLAAAAKTMQANNVKRLVVADDAGELLGIVSRADLLRVYARPDTAIRRDVIDQVLRRALWIDTSQVQVRVDGGQVTLAGTVDRRTTAALAVRLAAQVPGVIAVVDELSHEFDDTRLARSNVHRTHPFSAEPFKP